MQLQISEGTAVQKLENTLQKVSKLEAQVLRLEQQIDEKNQTIYHTRTEAQNKIRHLKKNLFVSFCIFFIFPNFWKFYAKFYSIINSFHKSFLKINSYS